MSERALHSTQYTCCIKGTIFDGQLELQEDRSGIEEKARRIISQILNIPEEFIVYLEVTRLDPLLSNRS